MKRVLHGRRKTLAELQDFSTTCCCKRPRNQQVGTMLIMASALRKKLGLISKSSRNHDSDNKGQ